MSSAARGEDAQPMEAEPPADAATAPAADAPTSGAGHDEARHDEARHDDRGHAAAHGEPVDEEQASVDVMRLLSEHVPLTLLADLAQPTGPDSPDILEHEGLPDVAWWEPSAEEQQHH